MFHSPEMRGWGRLVLRIWNLLSGMAARSYKLNTFQSSLVYTSKPWPKIKEGTKRYGLAYQNPAQKGLKSDSEKNFLRKGAIVHGNELTFQRECSCSPRLRGTDQLLCLSPFQHKTVIPRVPGEWLPISPSGSPPVYLSFLSPPYDGSQGRCRAIHCFINI